MRAIIFEDNYLLAMTLEIMVKQMKLDVVASYDSADDLVFLVEDKNADFILMDVQLNGKKNGFEAVEELRKNSNIPVIFLSGNSSLEILNKIESFSNVAFISKPYTEENLKEKFIKMNLLEKSGKA